MPLLLPSSSCHLEERTTSFSFRKCDFMPHTFFSYQVIHFPSATKNPMVGLLIGALIGLIVTPVLVSVSEFVAKQWYVINPIVTLRGEVVDQGQDWLRVHLRITRYKAPECTKLMMSAHTVDARGEEERANVTRVDRPEIGEGLLPGDHDIGVWDVRPKSDGVAVVLRLVYNCGGHVVYSDPLKLPFAPRVGAVDGLGKLLDLGEGRVLATEARVGPRGPAARSGALPDQAAVQEVAEMDQPLDSGHARRADRSGASGVVQADRLDGRSVVAGLEAGAVSRGSARGGLSEHAPGLVRPVRHAPRLVRLGVPVSQRQCRGTAVTAVARV